jgi:LuxR family transcriptional regulator, maltose regulon positive regulatory protein
VISTSCIHGLTHPAPGNGPLTVRLLVVIASTLRAASAERRAELDPLRIRGVRTHTKHIYAKIGVTNRRAVVRRAVQLDLTRTRH